MTCDSVSKLIPLYFYGELTPDEEDRVEDHLHECRECTDALSRQRALAAALDQRQVDVPPLLLEDCRMDLMAAIQGGAPRSESASKGPWTLFLEAIGATFAGFHRLQRPVGAVALIALGFAAARFTSTNPTLGTADSGTSNADVFATVRSVRPDNAGHVQIAFDETRRRTISGSMEDQNIQQLLLSGARDQDASVRVESVGVLKDRCAGSGEVKNELLDRVVNDPNVGVRLEALKGLKPLLGDAAVRKTLLQVLHSDDNPAMRKEVVDLIVTQRDDSMVSVLQNLYQREDNNYVRLKLEKALKEMNASIGTF
ncbi:MAG TPA: HEAT repeat domain-containing protein [Bryobacteraceae bacterium]|nr:HEAT repeat domain-containing protein [Bryobacteraceae bacterium]